MFVCLLLLFLFVLFCFFFVCFFFGGGGAVGGSGFFLFFCFGGILKMLTDWVGTQSFDLLAVDEDSLLDAGPGKGV